MQFHSPWKFKKTIIFYSKICNANRIFTKIILWITFLTNYRQKLLFYWKCALPKVPVESWRNLQLSFLIRDLWFFPTTLRWFSPWPHSVFLSENLNRVRSPGCCPHWPWSYWYSCCARDEKKSVIKSGTCCGRGAKFACFHILSEMIEFFKRPEGYSVCIFVSSW